MANANDTSSTRAPSARSRKPELPEFQPAFTEDQVRQFENGYSDTWGEKRRLTMIALTRTPSQLAEGFRHIEDEAFMELLGHLDDFKAHCQGLMELAESASARMLAVGAYLALDIGISADCEHEKMHDNLIAAGIIREEQGNESCPA